METQVTVKQLICERCGHRWLPRQETVYVCPKCKNPKWNVPKVIKNTEQL